MRILELWRLLKNTIYFQRQFQISIFTIKSSFDRLFLATNFNNSYVKLFVIFFYNQYFDFGVCRFILFLSILFNVMNFAYRFHAKKAYVFRLITNACIHKLRLRVLKMRKSHKSGLLIKGNRRVKVLNIFIRFLLDKSKFLLGIYNLFFLIFSILKVKSIVSKNYTITFLLTFKIF